MTAPTFPLNTIHGTQDWPDPAMGRVAERVRKLFDSAIEKGRSASFGKRHWDLESACSEAAEGNCDGYGAYPVNQATYDRAKEFLEALPLTLPDPDIGADPDGEVSFGWRRGARDAGCEAHAHVAPVRRDHEYAHAVWGRRQPRVLRQRIPSSQGLLAPRRRLWPDLFWRVVVIWDVALARRMTLRACPRI